MSTWPMIKTVSLRVRKWNGVLDESCLQGIELQKQEQMLPTLTSNALLKLSIFEMITYEKSCKTCLKSYFIQSVYNAETNFL